MLKYSMLSNLRKISEEENLVLIKQLNLAERLIYFCKISKLSIQIKMQGDALRNNKNKKIK